MVLERIRTQRPQVNILGTLVDRLTLDETLEAVEEFISVGTPHLVVTADASGIVQAQSDPKLREIYDNADLVTPDSEGVVFASKRAGQPVTEKVSGVVIADRLAELSSRKGYRIYLLGAAPGVADMAAEALRLKYPGCNVVGSRHGFFPADSDEVVAQEVAAFHPDILLVAMGIPRQEIFIRKTQSIIQAKVGIGVGGSFDVFSGKTKRAPVWAQKLKLEWLWRLLLNPKKITKAKNLPIFLWRVLRNGNS